MATVDDNPSRLPASYYLLETGSINSINGALIRLQSHLYHLVVLAV